MEYGLEVERCYKVSNSYPMYCLLTARSWLWVLASFLRCPESKHHTEKTVSVVCKDTPWRFTAVHCLQTTRFLPRHSGLALNSAYTTSVEAQLCVHSRQSSSLFSLADNVLKLRKVHVGSPRRHLLLPHGNCLYASLSHVLI